MSSNISIYATSNTNLFGDSDLQTTDALDGYKYPNKYPLWHIITASIVVAFIIGIIILGNALVIVAIARDNNLKQLQNWFIASLAVSDLLLGLLIMPFSLANELMGYWYFGELLCEMWLSIDVLLCTASILNLCLISLDRYWSITRAVSYVKHRTKKKSILMIATVWILSAIICFPPLVGWKRPQPNTDGYPLCTLSSETGYVVYSTLGSFFIPLSVMVIVYFKIYLAARERARRHLKKNIAKNRSSPADNKINNRAVIALQTNIRNHLNQHRPLHSDTEANESAAEMISLTASESCQENTALNDTNGYNTDNIHTKTNPQQPICTDAQKTKENNENQLYSVAVLYSKRNGSRAENGKSNKPCREEQRQLLAEDTDKTDSDHECSCDTKPKQLANTTEEYNSLNVVLNNDKAPVPLTNQINSDRPISTYNEGVTVKTIQDTGTQAKKEIQQDASTLRRSKCEHCNSANLCVTSTSTTLPNVIMDDKSNAVRNCSSNCSHRTVSESHSPGSFHGVNSINKGTASKLNVQGTCMNSPEHSQLTLKKQQKEPSETIRPSSDYNLLTPNHCKSPQNGSYKSTKKVKKRAKATVANEPERMKRKIARARERRATLVLGIIMATFILCWLPFFGTYLISTLANLTVPEFVFAIMFWAGYCNSALNPIIYTIFNQDFRKAFQKIICGRRRY